MLNSFQRSKIRKSFASSRSFAPPKKDWNEDIDMVEIYEKVTNCSPKPTPGGYIGTCPFPDHQDNTPSFVMYTDTQSYYCFGCRKSGSASWFKKEMGRIYGI